MEIVKRRKPGLLKHKAAPVEAVTSFSFGACVFYSLLWSLTPCCSKLNWKYNFEAVFLLTEPQWKKKSTRSKLNCCQFSLRCSVSPTTPEAGSAELPGAETLQGALQTWARMCMAGGRDQSCQTTVICFWLGLAKQRLSGWRGAYCCVLGSVLLCSSDLSSLQPSFPSGDIQRQEGIFPENN